MVISRDEINVACENNSNTIQNANDESRVSRSDARRNSHVTIGVRTVSPRKKATSRRGSVGNNNPLPDIALSKEQSQGNLSSGSINGEKESHDASRRRAHRRKSATGIISNPRSSSARTFNTSASSGSEDSFEEEPKRLIKQPASPKKPKSTSSSRGSKRSETNSESTFEWSRETTKVTDDKTSKTSKWNKVRECRRSRSHNEIFKELQAQKELQSQSDEVVNAFEPFDAFKDDFNESLNLNDIPFFDEGTKHPNFNKSRSAEFEKKSRRASTDLQMSHSGESFSGFERKSRRASTDFSMSHSGESFFAVEKKSSRSRSDDIQSLHKSCEINTFSSPQKARSSKRPVSSRTKADASPVGHKDTSKVKDKNGIPTRKMNSSSSNITKTSKPRAKEDKEDTERSLDDDNFNDAFLVQNLYSPTKKKVINNFHESVVPVDISDFENSFSASEFSDEPGFLPGTNSGSFGTTKKIFPDLISPAKDADSNNETSLGLLDFNTGFDNKAWEPADNEFSFEMTSPTKASQKVQKDKNMMDFMTGTGDDGFGICVSPDKSRVGDNRQKEKDNDHDAIPSSPEKERRRAPRRSKSSTSDLRKQMMSKQQQSTSTLSSTSTTASISTASLLSSDSPVRLPTTSPTKREKVPSSRRGSVSNSVTGDGGERQRRSPPRTRSEELEGVKMYASPRRKHDVDYLRKKTASRAEESKFFSPPTRRKSNHNLVQEEISSEGSNRRQSVSGIMEERIRISQLRRKASDSGN